MPDFDSIPTLFWSAHKVSPRCALWSEAIQVYVFVFLTYECKIHIGVPSLILVNRSMPQNQ